MTEPDSRDTTASDSAFLNQFQPDRRLKTCSQCGKRILKTAFKCRYCKTWIISSVKEASYIGYASLFTLGRQRQYLIPLIGMALFLMVLNSWVFTHYSHQRGDDWLLKLDYSLICILANLFLFIVTYSLLILGLWGIFALFQVPDTQTIAHRARWAVILVATLIFSTQSYNMDELVSQQLFTISFKSPFQESPLQSTPHVLGAASLNLMTLLYPVESTHQSTAIPLEAQGNHLVLHANINSQGKIYRGRFLLDTGATHTILFKSFLIRNNLHLPLNTKRMNYQGLAGNSTAPLVYVDLTLGRIHVPDVLVMVVDDPPIFPGDGILGMNVLKQFRMDLNPSDLKLTLSQ